MSSPYAGLTRSSSRPIEHVHPEETHYLTLELGAVDPNLLTSCASIRLVGLETSTPFLQLGDMVFQGIHTRTLGTDLILDDRRVIAQSEHKVLFNPVQLIPRTETETEPEPGPGPGSHDPQATAPRTASGSKRPGRPRGRGRAKKRAGDNTT